MEFIDHTGHIFSLPHYSSNPIGYEFDENPYIFWFDNMFGPNLSIDCYYIKSIKLLLPVKTSADILSLNIKIEKSNHFRLIGSKLLHKKISENKSFTDAIEIDDLGVDDSTKNESDIRYNLTKDDIDFVDELSEKIYEFVDSNGNKFNYFGDKENAPGELTEITQNFVLVPFYIIANVNDIGTWLTNVLISVSTINETIWCPITVGGVFNDECEELTINGKNIGLNLPKDIVRSLYQTNFLSDSIDYTVWNKKLKEYFLNLMKIRSERGNFRSAITSLKWFGYGDKLSVYKLLQTDNELTEQYILDNFDLTSDIIASFNLFRNSTYISLSLQGVTYTDKVNEYDFSNEFFGENKPKLENLFDKSIKVKYDEQDISFYKSYYDHSFNELGLKLSCLKYYYEKYFLPIHLKIHRISITNQCFASNVKLTNSINVHVTEPNTWIHDNNISIEFPETSTIWLNSQIHYIDQNYNEFTDSYEKSLKYKDYTVYYLNDTCFSIPIKFNSSLEEYYFNCTLLLYKDDEKLIETQFSFYQTNDSKYNSLVIYPKLFNKNFDKNYWLDSNYTLLLLVNNNWYEYCFNLKMPELDIKLNKLEYSYDHELFKQLSSIDTKINWNAKMFLPDFINVNNLNFMNDLIDYMKNTGIRFIDGDKNLVNSNIIYYYYFDDNGVKHIISTNDGNIHLKENKEVNGQFELVESVVEINSPIYSSVSKNIYSFIDLYTENINIPNNNHLMNTIHLFDLFIIDENGSKQHIKYDSNDDSEQFSITLEDGRILTYGNNSSTKIFNLYKDFFNSINGEFNMSIFGNNKNVWEESSIENYLYDIYLMHDESIWYIVLISKDTVSNTSQNTLNYKTYKLVSKYPSETGEGFGHFNIITDDEDNLIIDDDLDNYNDENLIIDNKYFYHTYYIKYVRSDKKLLINRMNLFDMKGVYHFNDNDMIVCRLVNYDRLPFKLSVGNKWTIKPISIGIDNFENISSNGNIGLISIGENLKYEKGYYEVEVNYSIDNFVNESQKRTTKFKIV